MSYYYICDACGSFVTITDAAIPDGQDWVCAGCGSSRMWEFTNQRNALAHSEHIHRVTRSGLFNTPPRRRTVPDDAA